MFLASLVALRSGSRCVDLGDESTELRRTQIGLVLFLRLVITASTVWATCWIGIQRNLLNKIYMLLMRLLFCRLYNLLLIQIHIYLIVHVLFLVDCTELCIS